MSEWEDKLNTLLSDPNAMAQVMQMAQSLSQQMGTPEGRCTAPARQRRRTAASSTAADPAGRTAGQTCHRLLGGIDPAMLQKLLPVLGQMNRPGEQRDRRAPSCAAPVFETGAARQGRARRAARAAHPSGQNIFAVAGGLRDV